MTDREYLDKAQKYADECSTCCKVKVGSYIKTQRGIPVYGCNHGSSDCIKNGCRRIKLYGEASKNHRLPSDCDAIHSEIDAISFAAKKGYALEGTTIWVTRYPCEACARAIKAAGISTVVYGRKEKISPYTEQILAGVKIMHIPNWEREDNNE